MGSILQARRSGTLATKTAHNCITSNRFITQKPKMKSIAVTIEENKRRVRARVHKKETGDVEEKKSASNFVYETNVAVYQSHTAHTQWNSSAVIGIVETYSKYI